MRKLLLALALVGGLCTPALAQPVTQNTLTGNESWNAGQGPGGPGSFITSDIVRNSSRIQVTTIAGSIALGLTTFAPLADGGNLIVTAQPAAATITLPPNPFPDGGRIGICNPSAAAWATNVVTVVAASGQTLTVPATLTTLAANACGLFQFQRSNTNWYRIN